MSRDLKIYPLKIEGDKMNVIEKKPLAQVPFLIGVLGRVKAGKTLLVNSLFLSNRFYADDFQVKILISPTARNDPQNKHLIEEFDFVFDEYSEALLKELVEMIEDDVTENKYVIVLDDVIGAMTQKKNGKVDYITSLATKYRHIGNEESGEGKLSLCIVSQYFKYFTPILRNNMSALYIMGKFPEPELKKIADAYSFFGGSEKEFIELYKKARKTKYDFLFLNIADMLAMRSHEEIIWKDSDDEDNESEEK
tara:strand:+ start:5398 stop:6150 length:753 start_codon:yes stop_codon:yes gene_type:complete